MEQRGIALGSGLVAGDLQGREPLEDLALHVGAGGGQLQATRGPPGEEEEGLGLAGVAELDELLRLEGAATFGATREGREDAVEALGRRGSRCSAQEASGRSVPRGCQCALLAVQLLGR